MNDLRTDILAKAVSSTGKPEFFNNLTAFLKSILPFENVLVLVFNGEATPTPILVQASGEDVFSKLEDTYLSATYVLDPVYHFHTQREQAGIYWLGEMAPDNFFRTHYYKWYYGRIGILDEITVFHPVNESTTITVSMGTDTASGMRFSTKHEKALKKIGPVIHALIESDWDIRKQLKHPKKSGDSLPENLKNLIKARHGVKLSNRQAQIAFMILRGHSSPSIAGELEISPQTVKVFRRQLYTKCKITSQSELFNMMLPLLGEISAFSNE